MTLTFLLDYQQISRTDKSIVVAGSVNYLRAKFSPKSDDWKLPVTALFNGMAVLLDENWECAVPWEVVQQSGTFTVSAFCGSLQTANTVTVPVVASGYKNGETPPEPTPDVYNQILGVMQEAKDAAKTAQEAAEHAPTIIDGIWHEWDAEAGEYKSTGTQAQGPEGEQGPKGDKGDRGDKGDTGATGAQGPVGPTGETGPVGPQGVPGTAATITIGSVTESAPGGDASVTNSGTATAAVLDFVIPRGETGPTGATGATGPAGLGVPQPTADDAGKIPVVNADGSGYELSNLAPEVDDTLSIPGAPADAKATGDAIAGLADELNSLERTIELYYQMRRTGKVYQTKLWKFASNPTSTGEKLRDNAGLVFEPSTDMEEGQDDYLSGAHPMFEWVNVNYVRDDDGAPRPTAIEGMESYATTGAVDVGVMQMSFWWKWDDSPEDHVLVTVSDTPHPELGLQPWPECVKADDTVLPWCIGSKYFSGTASDGLLRSQPRLLPELWQSYNGMITGYQLKGAGYWGAGAVRNTWQMLWIAIKGGTKSSQSLFAGCTNYSLQYQVAAATTAQTYVVLSEAQAQNLVVGSCVCVGTGPGEGQTSLDRNYDYMRDIVPLARIDRIDGANVYLDCNAYNVPEGAYLSSMPWGAGSTDLVFGKHDGSRISNTNGKFPYRVQGREYAIGSYCVASDTVAYLLDNNSREIYVAPRGVAHSPTWATIQSTYTLVGNIPAYNDGTATDYYVGDVDVSMALGAWYPSAEGTSSATGFADRYYAGGSATNTQREYLQGGGLGGGSSAGSACVDLGSWLGNAYWYCAACD